MNPAVLPAILSITSFDWQSGAVMHHNTRAHMLGAHRAPAAAERPLWAMDLAPRKDLDRPYDRMGFSGQPDRVPTVVSRRLGAAGPVGSVGYVTLAASHAVDPAYLSNAVANQEGAPSQTVGAQVAYNFH